jgi:hypothetical protein
MIDVVMIAVAAVGGALIGGGAIAVDARRSGISHSGGGAAAWAAIVPGAVGVLTALACTAGTGAMVPAVALGTVAFAVAFLRGAVRRARVRDDLPLPDELRLAARREAERSRRSADAGTGPRR